MPEDRIDTAPSAAVVHNSPEPATDSADTSEFDALVEADLLIEDVSIDGMCGVY